MSVVTWLVFSLAIVLLICSKASARDVYGPIIPKLTSEVQSLTAASAARLFWNICAGVKSEPAQREKTRAYQCIPAPDARLRDITPTLDGVIYGHFLKPDSDDAAMSGWAGEGHPQFFGGTLLLTRRSNTWRLVWYKSSVITRHCRKISVASGRDILVCEEQDSGMGHKFDLLYAVNFLSPRRPWEATVFVADNFRTMCDVEQQQVIGNIDFSPITSKDGRHADLSIVVLQGRNRLSARNYNSCMDGKAVPSPPLKPYRLDFVLAKKGYSIPPWGRMNADLTSQQSSDRFSYTAQSR